VTRKVDCGPQLRVECRNAVLGEQTVFEVSGRGCFMHSANDETNRGRDRSLLNHRGDGPSSHWYE
jgi:hypothetical protein